MKINLAKLHDGLNELTFQIEPEDLGFDEDEETLYLFPDTIEADVEVQKFSDKFLVRVMLSTVAHFTCDRCLEEFDRHLQADFQLVYSKQSRNQLDDDVYRSLDDSATEINLNADVRENLLLDIPMKHLCREDCQGLCSQCGINLNRETCECEQTVLDPRWEVLRNLQ